MKALALVGGLALAGTACSDSTGPAAVGLSTLSPAPAATGVPGATPIVLTFEHPMESGMEQFVDLHQGGIGGSVVPMTCAWSPDQTTLTCVHPGPLAPGTQHAIHVGGGMRDQHGDRVHLDPWSGMGGQWCTGGMMAGGHDGHPVDSLGGHWKHGNHYGMHFTFTTA